MPVQNIESRKEYTLSYDKELYHIRNMLLIFKILTKHIPMIRVLHALMCLYMLT